MESSNEVPIRFTAAKLVAIAGLAIAGTVALMVGLNSYNDHMMAERRVAEEQIYRERGAHLGQRAAEFVARSDALYGVEDTKAIFADLLTIARDITSVNMRPHLTEKYGGRAKDIIARADELVLYEKAVREVDEANQAFKTQEARVDELEKQLTQLSADSKKQSFIIYRRFDTDAMGRGIYDAYDVQNVRKCVLIAGLADISGVGTMQQSDLYVKFAGDQPVEVQKYNAFQNFKTTEYMPTYEATKAGGEIRDLQERLREAQNAKWAARSRWEGLNTALLDYHEKARQLAGLLDDHFAKVNLAERFEEVVKRPFGVVRLKDGEFTRSRNDHGQMLFMFRKAGMSVDEALGYAKVMGAKEEHVAKPRRAATTIAYGGKRGGVTIFLDGTKANQVMFWLPEEDYFKSNGLQQPCAR